MTDQANHNEEVIRKFHIICSAGRECVRRQLDVLRQAGSERVYADITSIHFRQNSLDYASVRIRFVEPDSKFTMDISNCIAPTSTFIF
jgi:hypothetical protein